MISEILCVAYLLSGFYPIVWHTALKLQAVAAAFDQHKGGKLKTSVSVVVVRPALAVFL